MEIKIQCPCGQKFKFNVVPDNGRLPYGVSCPTCGADATQLANDFLAESFAAQPTPVPNATPAEATENRRLRIHRLAPTQTATSPAADTVPSVVPVYRPLSAGEKELNKLPARRGKPAMGIMAGVVAGALAAFVWYLLTLATGREIRLVSWIIGVAVGLGMRYGCPNTHKYGSIAVLITILAIIGGQYFVIQHLVNGSLDGLAENAYVEHAAFARKALNASSDQEISKLFAEHYGKNEFFVTKEEVQDFRASLPELQDFLNGKPSKAEYIKTIRGRADTLSYKWSVFQRSRRLGFLMWLVFGIVAAYRVVTG